MKWMRLQLLLLIVLVGLASAAWGTTNPLTGKNVLVLHSYNQTYAWTDQEMEGIVRVLRTVDPTHMPYVEYLDWKRFPDAAGITAFTSFLAAKYRGIHMDAVIVTDNKALDFALEHRPQLFPDAAVSFCGINDFKDAMIAGRERVSGVVENVDPEGTIRLISQLLPETREIVVLMDDTESSRGVLAEIQRVMENTKAMKLRVLQSLNHDELIAKVSELGPGSVILQGPYLRDRDGRSFNFENVLERILPHSKVPIFSFWDFLAGKGITGGSLLSGVKQGEKAAEVALRLMQGEAVVPVVHKSPTRVLVDDRQLRRFGLGSRPLPKEVEIINRPPSLLREHLAMAAGILATIALLTSIIVALVFAIRRRHQVEQSLRESEERYRTVVDNIPLGVSLIGPDHRIIMINRTQAELFGHPPEWFHGRYCYREFEHRDHVCAHCPGTESMKTGTTSHAFAEGFSGDGKKVNVHLSTAPLLAADGTPYGFIEVVEDITERIRAEEEARANSRRMASLYGISKYHFTDEAAFLDHALDEVIRLTDSSIGYIFCYSESRRQFTLSSWSKGVMEECAITRQQRVYDLEQTGLWGEAVRQAGPVILNDFAGEHPLKRGLPEGHVALERFLTVPVMSEGSIVAVVGVANKESDYTDADVMQLSLFMDSVWKTVVKKRAEEERLKLEKQLLHAQKLESLGVLAGGIAHDFNNILMAIIGNADLALMRLNKESPVISNLHRIEKAAAQAADLAKQMLAYSGKGKFYVEKLDLNRLLEEMLHMLEVSISKSAVLRLNFTQSLPAVEADATQMRQVIMNLVINASEAIGERSGVIAVNTGCMDCDRTYLKDVWLDENIQPGHYVYLEIADTGCGMDKETMEKLFDPFFTTKFTGRGLGMAAVLGIVRGHKGAIRVYSELGKGTSFKILLPASEKPAAVIDATSHDDWRGQGRVLLVDDEESVRGIGTEMLGALGFEAFTACDGREALEVFRSNPGIDFVILDLTMPRMDGEQCFRELRSLNPDVKVIMSSGYNQQEVTQKFVGKGLAGFIQKPYRLSVLKDAIRGMISPTGSSGTGK